LQALALLALVMLVGGVAFYLLGRGLWTFDQALYMALKDQKTFHYNPPPAMELPGGAVLVVFGEWTEVDKLRRIVASSSSAPG